jgi:hypothetical protein
MNLRMAFETNLCVIGRVGLATIGMPLDVVA